MTTVQTMLKNRCRAALLGCALFAAPALLQGCNSGPKLVPPSVLVAPYETSQGDALWAVAPLANESGVSFVDTMALSDALAARIDETRGITCLPLNRTLAAMNARGLSAVRTPQEARVLANSLGVDALVVGSVTAYDPYDPPKIGLSVALFSREGARNANGIDPMKLHTAYTDYDKTMRSQYLDRPIITTSDHLDGANHEVQMELERYSQGRHESGTALGWKSYLVSMDLYTEFAAYHVVSRLLEQERLRLGQPIVDAEKSDR